MKIDFSQTLNSYDGTPFTMGDKETLTLKSACLQACSTPAPGDDQLPPMGKFHIGEIGAVIFKDMDPSTEQVSKLKARVEKVFLSPALVYAIHQALEGGIPTPAAKKR